MRMHTRPTGRMYFHIFIRALYLQVLGRSDYALHVVMDVLAAHGSRGTRPFISKGSMAACEICCAKPKSLGRYYECMFY